MALRITRSFGRIPLRDRDDDLVTAVFPSCLSGDATSYCHIAQSVEQRPVKSLVLGSSPGVAARFLIGGIGRRRAVKSRPLTGSNPVSETKQSGIRSTVGRQISNLLTSVRIRYAAPKRPSPRTPRPESWLESPVHRTGLSSFLGPKQKARSIGGLSLCSTRLRAQQVDFFD